jgi:hypothetical protein
VDYLSECCDSPPYGELDMSTLSYGGPSGFCSTCYDNCIFKVADAKCYYCENLDDTDDFIWANVDGELHLFCWDCTDKIHKGEIESC